MPQPDRPAIVAPLRGWSRRPLDRVPPVDLYGAWMFAQADCALALEVWRTASSSDKGDAYAAYVAALDREEHAAGVLAERVAPPTPAARAA